MNGFLLFGRCAMDDVPLGLFETREEAAMAASVMTPDDVCEAAMRVLELDVDLEYVLSLMVVPFHDGVPGLGEHVVEFDDDSDGDSDDESDDEFDDEFDSDEVAV